MKTDNFVFVQDTERPLKQRMIPGVVYIYKQWLMFLCPCGCGEMIMLNTNKKYAPPCWTLTRETGSIHPSVNQTTDCKSHFWIRNNKVEWC